MNNKLSIPSCKRCRINKIRCDKGAPSCNACVKAKEDCILVDGATGEECSRQSIAVLEDEERRLRASLAGDGGVDREAAAPSGDEFIGEASGSSFFETMLSSQRWAPMKAQLLQQLRHRDGIRPPETQRATLPSAVEAKYYIDAYLSGSHLHHPFLLAQDVHAMHQHIYATGNSAAADSEDLFRLLMICAIAAVSLQRRAAPSSHPYGFFLSAQDYSVPGPVSISAIENMLLLARFGIYFHIGSSIWEIARLCMRQCIEWEYHLPPRKPMDPLQEQHRRRVFWECYILDRYASSTLGRPFAIADGDIEVSLPVPFNDEICMLQPNGRLDDTANTPSSRIEPDDMAIFVWVIQLRQITSRIHAAFFTQAEDRSFHSSGQQAGEVYASLYGLLDELAQWRKSGPIFGQAVSLYQRQDWFDFLLEKERLSLIRGAIDTLPKRKHSPPKELVPTCVRAATRVIHLYQHMFTSGAINVTRGYFQMLFTAGLSLIYCCSSEFRNVENTQFDRSTGEALGVCAAILKDLSQTLVDSRPYAYAFDLIQSSFVAEQAKRGQLVAGSLPSTSRGNNTRVSTKPVSPSHATDPHPGIGMSTFDENFIDPTLPPMPGLDDFADQDWFMSEWDPLTSQLVSNMETDVSQYAVGNWMWNNGSAFGSPLF